MSQTDIINQLNYVLEPLTPWLTLPGVEEIAINKPFEVFVRKNGIWSQHDVLLDYEDCYDLAVLGAALRRQTVGDNAPIVGEDVPFNGHLLRLQSVLPPAVPSGVVSHTIRRFEDKVAPASAITARYDTSRWNKWQNKDAARQVDFAAALAAYDSGDIDAFLAICVQKHMNILLSGSTGAGKTTMARSLTAMVDMAERIITIEDALEMVVPHPNCVRLLYSEGGLSNDGVTSTALLTACLRMRPSRIILQEIRNPEAAYVFVMEGLTGVKGCLTTLHGGSAPEAYKRLFSLFKGSPEGRAYKDEVIHNIMASAIDVIIPLHNDGATYSIRETWFAPDAERRGAPIHTLLGA